MGGAIAGEEVGGLRLRSEGGARNIVVFALRQIFFGRKLSTGQNFPKGPVHTRTHTRVNIFPSAHRHRNESLIVNLMSTYDRKREIRSRAFAQLRWMVESDKQIAAMGCSGSSTSETAGESGAEHMPSARA